MRWKTAHSRRKRLRRNKPRALKLALVQVLRVYGKRGSLRKLRAMHKL